MKRLGLLSRSQALDSNGLDETSQIDHKTATPVAKLKTWLNLQDYMVNQIL